MSMDFLIEFYIELIIDLHEAVRNNKDRSHVHFTISPNPLNFKTSKTSDTAVTLEVFETSKKEMWSGRGGAQREIPTFLWTFCICIQYRTYALCCKSLFLWISSPTVDKVPQSRNCVLSLSSQCQGRAYHTEEEENAVVCDLTKQLLF